MITFAGDRASVPRDPVAAIRFSIGGWWELWDIPFNTKVGIRGALNVRADGSASIQVTSEKGWVNHRSTMSGACPTIAPLLPKVDVPKVPIPQIAQLIVYFSPAGIRSDP